MNRGKYIFLALLCVICLGFTRCQTTNTVVVPQGQAATQLSDAKDKQISDLKKELEITKDEKAKQEQLASKAASNVKGILKGADYLEDNEKNALPKEAIQKEAALGLQRLPTDDPAETVKALERVVLIVTGQRDEALKQYADATRETDAAKQKIKELNTLNIQLDNAIHERDAALVKLKNDADIERIQHTKDVTDAINKVKIEAANKEKALWLNILRIGSVAIMLGGVVLIALTSGSAWLQGGLLILGGGLVGGIAIAIDIVTSQWWFPYACAGVGAIVFLGGGLAIYHLWQTHQLNTKLNGALQDCKDESLAMGKSTWSDLQQHLDYRLGTGFWAKAQQNVLAQQNLINKQSEPSATPATPKLP